MTNPTARQLMPEELALCRRLNLDYGFDDDNEEHHQYTHICWPYAAYQGALCGAKRLWFHGGSFASRPETCIDCHGCFDALTALASSDAKLLAVIEHLAEAVAVLEKVEQAAEGFLKTTLMEPEFAAAVKKGYPTTSADELRRVIRENHERHRVRATAAFGRR